MRGRTISIYFPEGNVRSFKICEIKDSIVKSIFIPRNKLKEVSKRSNLQEPGIYFLFGGKDEVGKSEVYIGEAENLISRLKQQNLNKDFWNTAICFLSEKKNLNKAHIKFLENYCCEKAELVNKCRLLNSSTPTKSTLTEQERDFVLSFFDDLKILISILGYPIFEEAKKEKENIFICKGKDAYAEGEYSEDGFTVFKNSRCNLEESRTAGNWVIGTRKKLIEKGILKKEKNVYVFVENYTFSSPSTAAATVLARRANGWTEWKDESGITLDRKIRKSD